MTFGFDPPRRVVPANVNPFDFSETFPTPLISGEKTFEIMASDVFDFSTTINRTLNVDNLGPLLVVSFEGEELNPPIASQNVRGSVSINVTASDLCGVAQLDLYLGTEGDDTPPVASVDGEGPLNYRWDTDTPLWPDGKYEMEVVGTDVFGQRTTFVVDTIWVNNSDQTPPEVQLTGPSEGAYVRDTVTMRADAIEDDGDMDVVEFWVDGGNGRGEVGRDNLFPYSVSWDTIQRSLSGEVQIGATAVNFAGLSQTHSYSVVVDNIHPTITIDNPPSQPVISGDRTLTATANDNEGIDHVEFFVGGVGQGPISFPGPYEFLWRTSNGEYTVEARAYDLAGNENEVVEEFTVTVDNLGPAVVIISPDGLSPVSGTVDITADVSDNLNVAQVEFYVGSILLDTQSGRGPSDTYTFGWDASDEPDARYNLYVVATDDTGNETTGSVGVDLENPDLTAPLIFMVTPENDDDVAGLVRISGTAEDSDSGLQQVEVLVKGQSLGIATNSPFEFDWDTTDPAFRDGINNIVVTARDNAGNSASLSIRVTVDNTPPIVILSGVAEGDLVRGTVDLTATADPDDVDGGVDFYIEGTRFNVPDSPYVLPWDTTLSPQGTEVTIQAKAYDLLGNEGRSQAINVTVDNPAQDNAPSVTFENPVEDDVVQGEVLITATVTDDQGVTEVQFFIDNVLRRTVEGTGTVGRYVYPWNSDQEEEGPYSLSVKATDNAGFR